MNFSPCPVCGVGRLVYHVGNNQVLGIECLADPPCEIPPSLFSVLAESYLAEFDHRRKLQNIYLEHALAVTKENDRWEFEMLAFTYRVRSEVVRIKFPLASIRANYPRWIICPDECGEYICTVHRMHVPECDCPEIDDLEFDPYTTGGLPYLPGENHP